MQAHLDDLPSTQRELDRLVSAQGGVKHATALPQPPLQSKPITALSPTVGQMLGAVPGKHCRTI